MVLGRTLLPDLRTAAAWAVAAVYTIE